MQKNPYLGRESTTQYVRRRSARSPEFAAAHAEEFDRLTVANEIRRVRERRKLSQEQLAARVGTSQPHIARLETGRATPRLDVLHRIATALNFRLDVRFVTNSR